MTGPDNIAATAPPARPLLAGSSLIKVGTCSWTDPTLVKESDWYPKRTMTAQERLQYYSSQFCVVEADSTYYRPLSPELARSWAERSPEGFCFDIKAFGLLTGHPVERVTLWPDIASQTTGGDLDGSSTRRVYSRHLPPDALEEVWARFVHALAPLRQAGRLGAVLLQYPSWFTPNKANKHELSLLPGRLDGARACVEFRSPLWLASEQRDRTLSLLRELGIAHVVVDAPVASGLGTVVATTRDDLAVARFHGRADATWKAKVSSAAERFRYLYTLEELAGWAPNAMQLAQSSAEVHLLMNNCYRDYGTRNASQLAEILAREAGEALS
ncbi:MAG TPA: DUF72 domain-containing protein [Acidimicrobiales bacterium]|nr:DUF72 domain-containing protein [Acidimicrobiales bacterium]